MRRASRRDLAENPIVVGLRIRGATVHTLSQRSLPDLLVGFRKRMYLLEVKTPATLKASRVAGQLTPDQKKFNEEWRGPPVHIVHSLEEALAVLGIK